MKFPFSDPQLKISRARKHFAELEQVALAYITSQPIKLFVRAAEIDGKPDVELTVEMTPPPEELGAILGDIIHNLRTALDLTACDMVRAIGGNDKGVYFPFCENADYLDKQIETKNFHRAGLAAIALGPVRNSV